MKKLFDISWQVEEDEYRKDSALSYSTLARYERTGFNGLSSLFDHLETPSLSFGSAVDSIITGGEEEFKERFVVATGKMPEESVMKIVKFLYKTDTSTNVFPSIHVYNTLCVEIAILKSRLPKKHKGITTFVVILSVLIIAATVFLKQHSIIDVFGAFGMAFLFYLPIYLPGDLRKMREKKESKLTERAETTESAA